MRDAATRPWAAGCHPANATGQLLHVAHLSCSSNRVLGLKVCGARWDAAQGKSKGSALISHSYWLYSCKNVDKLVDCWFHAAIDAVAAILALIPCHCAKEYPNKHINMINMRPISNCSYPSVRATRKAKDKRINQLPFLIADFRFVGNENRDMQQWSENWFAASWVQGGWSQGIPKEDLIRTDVTALVHWTKLRLRLVFTFKCLLKITLFIKSTHLN